MLHQPPKRQYMGSFKILLVILFLDNFNVYSGIASHLVKLRLCFEKRREYGINMNLEQCSLLVHSDIILEHVVSHKGKF